MLQMFNQNISRVTVILSLITVVLLLISIVLINNTIRLSVYSKRFIINTMKLVGAKAGFIRRPFICRSVLNGVIAALIALVLLAGTTYYLQSEIGATFDMYRLSIILPVVAVVFVFSILITYLATFFSVSRYIRMKTDHLYFI
ncbi:MAG: FtsX-like permease family protein [bacterium]|uniref:FtsX-like permease family protein n=1 Tax=Candidatus Aphodosoma intestinipullorum TaxID=2840674 RepID=A0A940IEV7_9BACT|nr:FtsX-like permease family protein [Candidatus Aphodosoma intestinipullorum]